MLILRLVDYHNFFIKKRIYLCNRPRYVAIPGVLCRHEWQHIREEMSAKQRRLERPMTVVGIR